jgi:uncharacterized protein (UPF0332 family)
MIWADLVRYRIERAQETLEDARKLYEAGSYRSAVNRAYYVIFYAGLAVLATKKLGTSKHSGVISLFNKEFVKTGLMSVESSKIYHKAFEMPLEGDYKDFSLISKEDAKALMAGAQEFLIEVQKYLSEHKEQGK